MALQPFPPMCWLCHWGCWAPLSQKGCAGCVDSSITACVGLLWVRALLCQGCNIVVPKLCNNPLPLWVPAPSPLLGAGSTHSGVLEPKSPPLALLISIWTLWDKLRPCSLSVPISYPPRICTRGFDLPTPDPGLHGAQGQDNFL